MRVWRNLAAAPGLGPGVLGRVGSTPTTRTVGNGQSTDNSKDISKGLSHATTRGCEPIADTK